MTDAVGTYIDGWSGPQESVTVNSFTVWMAQGTGAYWTESRTYNVMNQLTRQTVAGVFDQEYTLSATQNNGKLTGSYDHIANQQVTYTYDSLGRLSTAKTALTTQWGFSYGYDGFGNRTQQTLTQGAGPSSVGPAVYFRSDSTSGHGSQPGAPSGYRTSWIFTNRANAGYLHFWANKRR